MFKPSLALQARYQLTNPLAGDTEPLAQCRLRQGEGRIHEIAPADVKQATDNVVEGPPCLVALNSLRPLCGKKISCAQNSIERERTTLHTFPLLEAGNTPSVDSRGGFSLMWGHDAPPREDALR